jgi:hypothetical protein
MKTVEMKTVEMKTVEYWKEHPDEFAEEVLGIKLFPYQKKIIKDICESSNRYIPMYSRAGIIWRSKYEEQGKTR